MLAKEKKLVAIALKTKSQDLMTLGYIQDSSRHRKNRCVPISLQEPGWIIWLHTKKT